MTSAVLYSVLVGLMALERLAELVIAKNNLRWSRQRGGYEVGFGHYPFMVALHTGLLAGCLLEAWLARPVVPLALAASMVALVLLAQALRWWCIATLGRQWNTRVIVVPGLSLVRRGPYRLVPHPNYVAVVVEGFALPLVHLAWITALVFSVLNSGLLVVRIRVENAALRSLSPSAAVPRSSQGVPR